AGALPVAGGAFAQRQVQATADATLRGNVAQQTQLAGRLAAEALDRARRDLEPEAQGLAAIPQVRNLLGTDSNTVANAIDTEPTFAPTRAQYRIFGLVTFGSDEFIRGAARADLGADAFFRAAFKSKQSALLVHQGAVLVAAAAPVAAPPLPGT